MFGTQKILTDKQKYQQKLFQKLDKNEKEIEWSINKAANIIVIFSAIILGIIYYIILPPYAISLISPKTDAIRSDIAANKQSIQAYGTKISAMDDKIKSMRAQIEKLDSSNVILKSKISKMYFDVSKINKKAKEQ